MRRDRPRAKEPAEAGGAIRRLAERFFQGSVEALAAHLVARDLDPEQPDRIQALMDAQRRGEGRRRGPKEESPATSCAIFY